MESPYRSICFGDDFLSDAGLRSGNAGKEHACRLAQNRTIAIAGAEQPVSIGTDSISIVFIPGVVFHSVWRQQMRSRRGRFRTIPGLKPSAPKCFNSSCGAARRTIYRDE